MTDAIRTMQKFAEEDIDALVDILNSKYSLECDCISTDYQSGMNDDETEYLDVYATFKASGGYEFDLSWTYATDPDDHDNILMDATVEELAEVGEARYNEAVKINSSKTVNASVAILAADEEDEFRFEDEEDVESYESGGFDDQLDSISDDIDDLKDAVDEIQEDDVNIEIDNNIDGHYIAECDRCGGIFISAVSESDQILDLIHGVCPLCDHETDQYLKWVIKAVD